MKNFKMNVENVFYLSHNRMVFLGHFVSHIGILPIDVIVYVNNQPTQKIKLTTLPFSIGTEVKNDLDCIEASEQIDLKFVNWGQDSVVLLRC